MISFRSHVVSLVAVFLALAVGVALGGGPLNELGRTEAGPVDTAPAAAVADLRSTYGDTFGEASAPVLLGKRLEGQSVAVLRMPDADDATVAGLTELVQTAGGTVVSELSATAAFADPGQRSLIDTLGSQLQTRLKSAAVGDDASTYIRLGQLLGLATLTPSTAGAAPDQAATAVRQSLAGAELLTFSDDAADRATLLLVVSGDELDPDVASGLLTGLAPAGLGVVVAASTAAGVDGDLADLRERTPIESVSTVDGVETGLGRITTVLALADQIEGAGGAFGASGADGTVTLG